MDMSVNLVIIPSNKDANSLIKQDIENFISIVLKEVLNVSSIVLEGSYGRKEGAYVREGKKLELVNDIDFLLISNTHIKAEKIKLIKKKFLSISSIGRVDIAQELSSRLHKLKPTLLNYDRKFGSTVIYGNKKLLDDIPYWMSTNIPTREAEKLLMTRLIGFILLYKYVFLEPKTLHDGNFLLKQQLSKSVIAVVDALLISLGLYHTSYKHSANSIENLNIFNESEKALISESFTFKLFPIKGEEFNIKEYYFRVKKFFIKYFFQVGRKRYKDLGESLDNFDYHYLWNLRKLIIGFYQFTKNGRSSIKQEMHLNLAQLFFVLSIDQRNQFNTKHRVKSLKYINLVSDKNCSPDFPSTLIDEILRLRM